MLSILCALCHFSRKLCRFVMKLIFQLYFAHIKNISIYFVHEFSNCPRRKTSRPKIVRAFVCSWLFFLTTKPLEPNRREKNWNLPNWQLFFTRTLPTSLLWKQHIFHFYLSAIVDPLDEGQWILYAFFLPRTLSTYDVRFLLWILPQRAAQTVCVLLQLGLAPYLLFSISDFNKLREKSLYLAFCLLFFHWRFLINREKKKTYYLSVRFFSGLTP